MTVPTKLLARDCAMNTKVLYELRGRVDGEQGWRSVVPFAYVHLQNAKVDAEFYCARYVVVHVVNRATGRVEYTASRAYTG